MLSFAHANMAIDNEVIATELTSGKGERNDHMHNIHNLNKTALTTRLPRPFYAI